MLRIRIVPALMMTAVLIFGSAASLGMVTVGSSKSFAQETNCRIARIARADLPEFCRRTCPGHPECRNADKRQPTERLSNCADRESGPPHILSSDMSRPSRMPRAYGQRRLE